MNPTRRIDSAGRPLWRSGHQPFEGVRWPGASGRSARSRSGNILVVVMMIMLTTTIMGLTLAETASRDLTYAVFNWQRSQAETAADAGVDYCIWYLKNTAPDGTTDGSWRTLKWDSTQQKLVRANNAWTTTMPTSAATVSVEVSDIGTGRWTGDVQITGVGTSGSETVTATTLIQIWGENVSPYANAIFGGSSQGGNAINGNVTVHGSMHILGDGEPYTDVNGNGQWDNSIPEPYVDTNHNGVYDTGEPFTDVNGNGKWDSSVQEPYTDVDGNGAYTPPLTTVQLASSFGGNASVVLNNYEGEPAIFTNKLPSLPTANVSGTVLNTLHSNFRVKHGEVSLSGSATVGQSSVSSTSDKASIDGSYVSNGYAGSASSSVYSDNGTSHVYDLPSSLIKFPSVIYPVTVNGVAYPDWLTYLSSPTGYGAYQYSLGTLTLNSTTAGTQTAPYTIGSGSNTLSFYVSNGNYYLNVNGVIQVTAGDVVIGQKGATIYYTGTGTIVGKGTVSTVLGITKILTPGNIYIHGNLIADGVYTANSGGFPNNILGLVSPGNLNIETGNGDSQSSVMGAFLAEDTVTFNKQTNVAGDILGSYFVANQVPDVYYVPAMMNHLPPGLPAASSIYYVHADILGYQQP